MRARGEDNKEDEDEGQQGGQGTKTMTTMTTTQTTRQGGQQGHGMRKKQSKRGQGLICKLHNFILVFIILPPLLTPKRWRYTPHSLMVAPPLPNLLHRVLLFLVGCCLFGLKLFIAISAVTQFADVWLAEDLFLLVNL